MLVIASFWVLYPTLEWTLGDKGNRYFDQNYRDAREYAGHAVVPLVLALVGLACSATTPVTVVNVPRRPRRDDRPE